jgi:hypothetical protein
MKKRFQILGVVLFSALSVYFTACAQSIQKPQKPETGTRGVLAHLDSCQGIAKSESADYTQLTEDPQVKIWDLIENGKIDQANQLTTLLIQELCSNDFDELEIPVNGQFEKTIVKFHTSQVQAIFKPHKESAYSSAIAEMATYETDRLLGTHLVPLTLIRRLNGKDGSIQVWVRNLTPGDVNFQIMERDQDPVAALAQFEDIDFPGIYALGVLDYLIANTDRNENNWLIIQKKNNRVVAIDHGASFPLLEKAGFLPSIPREAEPALALLSKEPKLEAALLDLKDTDIEEKVGRLLGVDSGKYKEFIGRVHLLQDLIRSKAD